jgi:hypothetical protein
MTYLWFLFRVPHRHLPSIILHQLSGSSAELILNKASFTGDTISTPDAHGGSVRVDRGALLRGANLTARGNLAGEDGGWLYASAATVELVDVLLDANQVGKEMK